LTGRRLKKSGGAGVRRRWVSWVALLVMRGDAPALLAALGKPSG